MPSRQACNMSLSLEVSNADCSSFRVMQLSSTCTVTRESSHASSCTGLNRVNEGVWAVGVATVHVCAFASTIVWLSFTAVTQPRVQVFDRAHDNTAGLARSATCSKSSGGTSGQAGGVANMLEMSAARPHGVQKKQ